MLTERWSGNLTKSWRIQSRLFAHLRVVLPLILEDAAGDHLPLSECGVRESHRPAATCFVPMFVLPFSMGEAALLANGDFLPAPLCLVICLGGI